MYSGFFFLDQLTELCFEWALLEGTSFTTKITLTLSEELSMLLEWSHTLSSAIPGCFVLSRLSPVPTHRLSGGRPSGRFLASVLPRRSKLSHLRLFDMQQMFLCYCRSNVLTLSQEKFASHVVEKALKYASPRTLQCLMNEIFDGYITDE